MVSTAEDGLTAIEMTRKIHYDIMFIDVVMPGIDGFQTLDEIKKIRPETKAIMMTGHNVEHLVEKAISLGHPHASNLSTICPNYCIWWKL